MPERLSVHELHHEERSIRSERAVVENRHDVDVRQPSRRLSLALESPKGRLVAEKCARQNLDRHLASEPDIRPAIHGAHTPSSDQTVEPVLAVDRALDGKRHGKLRAIGVTDGFGDIETPTAHRTLADQIDALGIDTAEHLRPLAACDGDSLAQLLVLEDDGHLRGDGFEQAAIPVRERLFGRLRPEQHHADGAASAAGDRNDELDAVFVEHVRISFGQAITKRIDGLRGAVRPRESGGSTTLSRA